MAEYPGEKMFFFVCRKKYYSPYSRKITVRDRVGVRVRVRISVQISVRFSVTGGLRGRANSGLRLTGGPGDTGNKSQSIPEKLPCGSLLILLHNQNCT